MMSKVYPLLLFEVILIIVLHTSALSLMEDNKDITGNTDNCVTHFYEVATLFKSPPLNK